ncbi:hypothetical protein [Romboutsia sp.]|uniref:hypothetical protein n=1 Tax=Romboutsia sp. TaxID=1965302 RepID=UPI002CE814A7|nr:hypothetical protein [Romboutsia sp.]HSQ90436.1 hypothetical protein [Romboutsia sp.]
MNKKLERLFYTQSTTLLSTGIRNPIEEIGEGVKKHDKVIYCVDAVSSDGGIKI